MLFFIDESGQDQQAAPYEVLAAVAIREEVLWSVIQAIHNAEEKHFGIQLKMVGKELKGRKLLKRKNFRFARQSETISIEQPTQLVREFLLKGLRELRGGKPEKRSREEFTAYGQAVLSFVEKIYEIAAQFRIRLFASMVVRGAPRPEGKNFLRKDYVYLFERIYYFLEDISPDEQGLIVFDEIEKAQARLLINQMEEYFIKTGKGRRRSSRIIPQPFFVHSDLTTAVQIADIMAYCLNWGFRLQYMTEPVRKEIKPFSDMAAELRYVGMKYDEMDLREWPVYGIVCLDDLRPREEKKDDWELC